MRLYQFNLVMRLGAAEPFFAYNSFGKLIQQPLENVIGNITSG